MPRPNRRLGKTMLGPIVRHRSTIIFLSLFVFGAVLIGAANTFQRQWLKVPLDRLMAEVGALGQSLHIPMMDFMCAPSSTNLEVLKVWTPGVKLSKADHLCRACGKKILEGRTHCGLCAVGSATERLVDAARVGRQNANSPEAQLKRANTQGQNALAQHAWKRSDQPTWLTATFYAEKIQPLLASMSASAIARQISVSRWYAGRIREGYRPHRRHWEALAGLVGVSADGQCSVTAMLQQ
jgi:hypothetical protein